MRLEWNETLCLLFYITDFVIEVSVPICKLRLAKVSAQRANVDINTFWGRNNSSIRECLRVRPQKTNTESISKRNMDQKL